VAEYGSHHAEEPGADILAHENLPEFVPGIDANPVRLWGGGGGRLRLKLDSPVCQKRPSLNC